MSDEEMAKVCGGLTAMQVGRLLASYGNGQPVSNRGGAVNALYAAGLTDRKGRITEQGRELCKWIGQRLT